MMNTVEVARVGLIVATIAQTLFVVAYATRPWWRHFIGRALMSKSVALMVTLQVTLLNWYVTYPYQLEVGAFLMWLIACAICFQVGALLWQIHLDRRASDGQGG